MVKAELKSSAGRRTVKAKPIYSSDLMGGALMVRESRIVAALLLDDVNESAWKHNILEHNVPQKNTKATAMRCAKTLRSRHELLPSEFLLTLRDGDEELAGQVVFCATLQHNLLLLEFMERVVKDAYTAHEEQLYMYQWLEFVDECGQRDTHVFNWKESSLKKMGGTVFRMLAEAGYLVSALSRKLQIVAEGAYKTFPANDDGIIPLSAQEWFPDDDANRFREVVCIVWGEERLQENLDFVAGSLCLHAIKPKKSEDSLDTVRRYLSTQFYKDHIRTYKKRPIYWLFSSGKEKAFECLVYLHRYNEGTLARMRTEYVIPLTTKLASHAEKLEQDKTSSGSSAEIKVLEKEIKELHKQKAELATFDEKLKHFADQRICLDLDDGVKVNYGKLGDLLACVKDIHGSVPEIV